MRYQIEIDGKFVDYSEVEEVASTYAANNLHDLSSRDQFYSNTFKLPITKKNQSIFGIAEKVNNFTRQPYKKLTARIIEGGKIVLEGFAQIKTVKNYYEVLIIGGNGDFFSLLLDTELTTLDISHFNHTYSLTSVAASQSNTWADGYIYALINFGRIKAWNSNSGLNIEDIAPCLFVKMILDKIIRNFGFTPTGSFWNFSQFENQLIAPTKEFGYDQDFLDARSCQVSQFDSDGIIYTGHGVGTSAGGEHNDIGVNLKFNNDSFFEMYNGAKMNYSKTTGRYTADQPMYVKVHIEMPWTVNVNQGSCQIKIALFVNGIDKEEIGKEVHAGFLTELIVPVAGAGPGQVFPTKSNKLICDYKPILLNTGDYIELRLIIEDTDPIVWNYELKAFVYGQTILKIDMLPNIVPGANFSVNSLLPNIKLKDLFLTVANQYNLIFQTDYQNKYLRIDFFDDVVKNLPKAKDWTGKLDFSELPETTFDNDIYGQNSLFLYKDDSSNDIVIKPKTYGNGILKVYNENIKPSVNLFESEFSATFESQCFNNASIIVPDIPIYQIKKLTRYAPWSASATYYTTPIQDYVTQQGRYFKCKGNSINSLKPPLYNNFTQISTGEWDEVDYITIEGLFDIKELNYRMLVLDHSNTDPVPIRYLANTVNMTAKARFAPLNFQNLINNFYQTLGDALKCYKYTKLLLRVNPLDLVNVDFTIPIYLSSKSEHFGFRVSGYYYLSSINQYKHGKADSCYVELFKIDVPPQQPGITPNLPSYLLLESGDQLLQDNGFGITI